MHKLFLNYDNDRRYRYTEEENSNMLKQACMHEEYGAVFSEGMQTMSRLTSEK